MEHDLEVNDLEANNLEANNLEAKALEANEDFGLVWSAVSTLLPASITPAFRHGITGSLARRSGVPLLASDLTHGLVPGLLACGVQAELVALPETEAEGRLLLRRQARSRRGMPLFGFGSSLEQSLRPVVEEENDARGAVESDPTLLRQGLLQVGIQPRYSLRLPSGETQEATYGDLLSAYSHGLLLRKNTARGQKAVHREGALRLWALFSRAYPDRLVTFGVADAARRALATDFWRFVAGSRRSALANRLGRAAELMAHARSQDDIALAFDLLVSLACSRYLLTPFVEKALLAHPDSVLSDVERRELIYLARAGTRDLKIFAASRLRAECACADALHTLQQLQYDPDPWVRAAARTKMPLS